MFVCDAIIVSTINPMLHAVVAVVMAFCTQVGDRENACAAYESCRIFLRHKNPEYDM